MSAQQRDDNLLIVVVTHNSAQVLPGLLDSLAVGLRGVKASTLVVVDNGSTDDTIQIVTAMAPRAVVVQQANLGYAAGINAGVAAGSQTQDWNAVLVLNPDVQVEPGAALALVRGLDDNTIGITVPQLRHHDGSIAHSLRREPTVRRAFAQAVMGGGRAGRFRKLGEVITASDAYLEPLDVDWATGAVMMISRQCWDDTGPWDESFFLFSEETDFALRARSHGWRCRYLPDAVAVHRGGAMTEDPWLWGLAAENRIRLYRKRHGSVSAAAFSAGMVLNELIRSVPPHHRRRHIAGLRASVTAAWDAARGTAIESTPSADAAPTYLCFAAQDWWYHNRAHSDFQLMRRIAERRTVLLVNSLTLRMPVPGQSPQAFRRIARKARSMARTVRSPIPELPNFHVMSPVLLPLYGSSMGRRLNASLVRGQVRIAARLLGIREPVVIVTIPTAWDVVAPMRRKRLLYNRSDLQSAFPEANGEIVSALEQHLLENADTILYVSRSLLHEDIETTSNRGFFLDHGVDLDHFQRRNQSEQPSDLLRIPSPRVGFFGGLDDYIIDFELLERVANDLPDAQLVLIGDATCSMSRLVGLPNVHWLGQRPYETIPAYGSGFDVALMPWLKNDWIQYANPIKLKEYLALGLPVVSTEFPEAEHYRDVIDVASDHEHFVRLIRGHLSAASSDQDRQRRRDVVRQDSWDAKAALLMTVAERLDRPHGES